MRKAKKRREKERKETEFFFSLCLFFSFPLHTPPTLHSLWKIINFGANPIRGVSGALGALGLPLGGATRGLPEQQFVKGKVYFLKSLNVENNSGFCWVGEG